MPSNSIKQLNFFRAVLNAKKKGIGNKRVKQVAKNMSVSSIKDFLHLKKRVKKK